MRPGVLAICVASVAVALPALASEIKDVQYGYSLSAPKFPPLPAGGSAVRLSVAAPPEGGFASNVSVMIQETALDVEQYVQLTERQFAVGGATMLEASRRQVSGRDAALFEYQAEMGGRSLHFLSLAVLLPERVLLVTCTAPVAAFPSLEPEFRRVLESFTLEDS